MQEAEKRPDSGRVRIIILEKLHEIGGNSKKASSGMNSISVYAREAGQAREHQERMQWVEKMKAQGKDVKPEDATGIFIYGDNEEVFAADTLKSSVSADREIERAIQLRSLQHETTSTTNTSTSSTDSDSVPPLSQLGESLGRALALDSSGALTFLHRHSVSPLTSIVQLGGHSFARTHRPAADPSRPTPPAGVAIISGLTKHIASLTKQASPKVPAKGLFATDIMDPTPTSGLSHRRTILEKIAERKNALTQSSTGNKEQKDSEPRVTLEIITKAKVTKVDVIQAEKGLKNVALTARDTTAGYLVYVDIEAGQDTGTSQSTSGSSLLTIPASALVLASGGFGANRGKLTLDSLYLCFVPCS